MVPDRRLSPHFLLSELLHSDTAAANGIPNDPTEEHLANGQRLVTEILEPIRERCGPQHVNSGYRSHALNAIRGGADRSAHMEFFAGDLVPKACGRRALFDAVLASDLKFDQLIWEITWIHVGLVGPGGVQRRQVLQAFPNSRGVMQYAPFNPNDPRVAA